MNFCIGSKGLGSCRAIPREVESRGMHPLWFICYLFVMMMRMFDVSFFYFFPLLNSSFNLDMKNQYESSFHLLCIVENCSLKVA